MKKLTPVQKLVGAGVDLNKYEVPGQLQKAAFAICNDYTNSKYTSLGAGPNNDAFHILKICGPLGYKCFHLRNGKSKRFLQVLDDLLQNTTEHLVIFYVGHGTDVKDTNGDEADGYDEAMVFDDAFVVDDILVEHLMKYKNDHSVVTLITDACHSGSIWDLQSQVAGRTLPPGIISISAANDRQTAKQTYVESMDQGMFTYHFKKALKSNPNASPLEIRKQIRPILQQKFCQNVVIATTSEELLFRRIF